MRRTNATGGFLFALLVVASTGVSAAWPPQVVIGTHYPRLAQLAHVQGTVVVDVMIDAAGKPARVEAASGHPLLKQAAVDSVKLWTFEKATGGENQRMAQLTFVFRIDEGVCKKQCCEDKFVFSYPDRVEVTASTLPLMTSKPDSKRH